MTTLAQLDKLKHQLDASRPFDPHRVRQLHENDRVKLTYHSIALEGNTLSETETAVLLEQGLTAQGKPLKHHLEAEDHAIAFDPVEFLTTNYNRPSEHVSMCQRHRALESRTRGISLLGANLYSARLSDGISLGNSQ